MCPRSLPGASGGGKSESASTRYVSGSDLCPAWETKLNWPQPCDPGMGCRSDGGRSVVNGKRVSQPLISHPHLQARALRAPGLGVLLIVDGVPEFDPGAQSWSGHPQPGTYLQPKPPQGCPESRAASWRGRSPTRVAEMPRGAGPGGGRLALQSARVALPCARSSLAPPPAGFTVL